MGGALIAPKRIPRPLMAIGGVVVVVILVIAGAYLAGIGPFSKSSPSSGLSGGNTPTSKKRLENNLTVAGFNEVKTTSAFYLNGTVTSAASGLTWSDVAFVVLTGSRQTAPGPLTLSVENVTAKCTIAVYNISWDNWSTPLEGECTAGPVGEETAIIPSEVLSIYSWEDIAGASDVLGILGQGPYDGSVTYPIP